jgi:hypothetical protein
MPFVQVPPVHRPKRIRATPTIPIGNACSSKRSLKHPFQRKFESPAVRSAFLFLSPSFPYSVFLLGFRFVCDDGSNFSPTPSFIVFPNVAVATKQTTPLKAEK